MMGSAGRMCATRCASSVHLDHHHNHNSICTPHSHETRVPTPLLQADWERALRTSTTLYIGNLSFFTREEQIYDVFSKCGHVERIVMGLDKQNKTPCGFCFVIYYTRCVGLAQGAA